MRIASLRLKKYHASVFEDRDKVQVQIFKFTVHFLKKNEINYLCEVWVFPNTKIQIHK